MAGSSQQNPLPTFHDPGVDFIDITEVYVDGESETITSHLTGGQPRNNVFLYCNTPLKTTSFTHPVVSPSL
ncbi:uncharacterized protein LY79DRAFT_549892, partial [Colletotrichum navitas]